jgi:hypothetical protein
MMPTANLRSDGSMLFRELYLCFLGQLHSSRKQIAARATLNAAETSVNCSRKRISVNSVGAVVQDRIGKSVVVRQKRHLERAKQIDYCTKLSQFILGLNMLRCQHTTFLHLNSIDQELINTSQNHSHAGDWDPFGNAQETIFIVRPHELWQHRTPTTVISITANCSSQDTR